MKTRKKDYFDQSWDLLPLAFITEKIIDKMQNLEPLAFFKKSLIGKSKDWSPLTFLEKKIIDKSQDLEKKFRNLILCFFAFEILGTVPNF